MYSLHSCTNIFSLQYQPFPADEAQKDIREPTELEIKTFETRKTYTALTKKVGRVHRKNE